MIEYEDPTQKVIIGWDIGGRDKPTGICVAQTQIRAAESYWNGERLVEPKPGQHFLVRFLERLPAGCGYPEMIERLVDIIGKVSKHDYQLEPLLKANVTGGGVPVVDSLVQELSRKPDGGSCEIEKVFVAAGDRRETGESKEVKLGKAWMVRRLQVLLQYNRVHMGCKHPMFKEMARDLGEFQLDSSLDPSEQGIFRVGRHDELVTALGLALQEDFDPPRGPDCW